ncbi:MAG: hypothetical protein SVV03_02390 [Candidatus Nanohaloarchaea archaeon]|nr:hypothetical protein [Candidatus Nanohaloarchaea archaeon]
MVLGNTLDIFLKVNVDIKELAALRVAQRRISKFSTRAQGRIGGLTARMGLLQRRFAQSEVSARSLSRSMQALNMRMLGIMFTGMNLAFMFGMILSLTPGLGGALRGLAGAISTALIPATRMLMPHIMKAQKAFLNMDKSTRKLFSKIVILGTILAVVLTLFGVLSMAILNIGSLIMSVIGIIGTVITAFQAWAAVGSFAMLSLKGMIAVISTLAAIVVSAFGIVHGAFMLFGKTVGLVVGAVLIAIGAVIAAVASVPVGIAVAVGAALAIIWNFKNQIISALQGVVDFIGGAFAAAWNGIKNIVGGVVSWIKNAGSTVINAGKQFGKDLVDGVIQGIKSMGSMIANAFWNVLPGPLASAAKGVSNFAGDLVGNITDIISANDFVVTSDGKIIQPSAQDTIIGTENPQALGGGGGQVSITIENPELNNDVDVESLIDEIERRLEQDQRSRSLI